MGQFCRIHKDDLDDRAWADFYLALAESGRERAAFYCNPRADLKEFISIMRRPENPWWLFYMDADLAGCVYLTDILGKSAQIHFAFLPFRHWRAACGMPSPVALGRYATSSILYDAYADGVHIMDVLVGKTPVWNKTAVKLLPRWGARVLGIIPACCHSHDSGADLPGVISYFTRESVPPDWANL